MALSSYLTRDEWNTCYFAGASEAHEGKKCESLADQLSLGIGALHRAGYEFKGIESTSEGHYTKVEQCDGGNSGVLAEMVSGDFDRLARAKETLTWVAINLPTMDWSWLADGVKEAEAPSSA